MDNCGETLTRSAPIDGRAAGFILSKLLFTLPNKPLHHRFWEQASGCKYLSQGVRIGIVACSELFGMDARRHKQTVNSKRGGALEVGSHRISDRQYPMVLRRSAPRPSRRCAQPPRKSDDGACRHR